MDRPGELEERTQGGAGLLTGEQWDPAASADLAHLGRVAILGELSGALAHELREPLTAILSNAQTLEMLLGRADPDLYEVRKLVREIINDNARASELIRSVRMFLRRGDRDRQPVDVNETITEVIDLERSDLIGRNIQVQLRLVPGLPPVFVDKVEIQQILLNLLTRARESTADVEITERVIVVSTGLTHDGVDRVRVVVSDRGAAVPAGELDRLFAPFPPNQQYGLGLGMSLCHSIAQANGAQLWAANNSDRGMSFYLALPAVWR